MPLDRHTLGRARRKLREGFVDMLARRAKLAEELRKKQIKLAEVERALLLIDRAEREIPTLLDEIASRGLETSGIDGRPLLAGEYRARRALKRVQADIPELRKYWLAKRRALGVADEPASPKRTA